jgi:hypothetical protein
MYFKGIGFFDVCWINLAVDTDRLWAVMLHGSERKIKGGESIVQLSGR